jgi:hypothetical protein
MAKTIETLGSVAVPGGADGINAARTVARTARRAMSFLRSRKDHDIERFIRQRGGVMTDDIDRELSRHFGRM